MWALVPLKGFSSAKQRLAGVLSDAERERLAQSMIADVLAVLAGHPDLAGVALVADDPAAEWLARYYEVTLLRESDLGVHGLNPVLTAALNWLGERGVSDVLVLHGDLPLLSAGEVSELIAAHRGRAPNVVLGVPDRRGVGTNALLLSLPLTWPLAFGHDSWQRHRQAAARAGLLQLKAISAPGLAFDVDLAEDLVFLQQQSGPGPAAATRRFLTEAGLLTRLDALRNGSANGEFGEQLTKP